MKNLKKFIASVLAVCVVLTFTVGIASAAEFTDVKKGWYYEPVMWAVEKGITSGTGNNQFSPLAICSRGQVVTFLWRAFGQQESKTTENPFNDVKAKAYYYKAVMWAVENGITSGTGKGQFSPDMKVTRSQFVTFLYRAMGQPEISGTASAFTDVKSTAYYYKAVMWAVENGVTSGTGNGQFSPIMECSRAQVVTFLYKALKNKITLEESAEINEGGTYELSYTVTGADRTLAWTSSDESVATVTNGVVTGVKHGTVSITAKAADGTEAICTVIVAGLVMNKTSTELKIGETDTLTATITPDNATNKTVVWTSSDESVATVENGVVTAVKAGTAKITAKTADGIEASCDITVKPVPTSGVTLNKTSTELKIGETDALTATIAPENATDKSVTWSSSDMNVATVKDGVVTAVAIGTAKVTAETVDGIKASCDITVKPVPTSGVTLNKTSTELKIGETETLTATIAPDNATNKSVTWTSSDESIATVKDGVVTAVAIGTAKITAETVDGIKASCDITVKPVPTSGVTLNKTSTELKIGETDTLTATITPDNATNKTVTWTSSDETVATVKDGVVTAVAIGTAKITAKTADGIEASCDVTVVSTWIKATSVKLSVESAELKLGNKLQLTATVLPANATDKTVTWSSGDESIATVDSNGVVTPKKVGVVPIFATSGDVLATCHVEVIPTGYDYLISMIKEEGKANLAKTEYTYTTEEKDDDGGEYSYKLTYNTKKDVITSEITLSYDGASVVTSFALNRDVTKQCTGESKIKYMGITWGSADFSFTPGTYDQDKVSTISFSGISGLFKDETSGEELLDSVNLMVYALIAVIDDVMFDDTPYSVIDDLGFTNYEFDPNLL